MAKKGNKMSERFYRAVWAFYHVLIVLFFAAVIFFGSFKKHGAKKFSDRIDADLFNMLPKQVTTRALTAADEKLTEKTAQNLFILVSNKDFNKAKVVAESVYEQLKSSDSIKTITLDTNITGLSDLLNFIRNNKERLLTQDIIDTLNTPGGEKDFCDNAVDKIFSSFNIVPLDLDFDPLSLTDECVNNYLNLLQEATPALSSKDGVLARFDEKNDLWYIMIRIVASKKGAALASPNNAVAKIYKVCNPLEVDGTRFVYSGTMFHSYKSSTNATKEIGLISTISLTIVAVILLFVFRSIRPIFLSLFSIILSMVTAFCATIAVFGKMHILTLVFGTSLIGSCIDYSLHFFITWKANKSITSGAQVRTHLLKGLTLSLVSTVLCYFVLLFAPFGLLRQMSVFSMAGITSTYLTAICIYPILKIPSHRKINFLRLAHAPHYNRKIVGRIVIIAMFAIGFLILGICHKSVIVKNDVKTLYKFQGRELTDEIEAAGVLQYNPTGWFIVSGDTKEDLLETEEQVTKLLKEFNKNEKRAGFVATSTFIPSKKRQEESLAAVKKLLPYIKDIYITAGYDETDAETLSKKYADKVNKLNLKNQDIVTFQTFNNNSNNSNNSNDIKNDFGELTNNQATRDIITFDDVPLAMSSLLNQTYLGEIDSKYYSVIMPVRVTNNKGYEGIAKSVPGVFFVNKVMSMNEDLDRLSRMIIFLFAVVYVVLFIVLKFFYTMKQTCKIISVPALIILAVFAVFAARGIAVEFFSITGMILVFGLGLDYVIYMLENEKRIAKRQNITKDAVTAKSPNNNNKDSLGGLETSNDVEALQLEPFAIMLSFVTTAVSFGALSLSKFIPVHNIGLAIFIGLLVSYVSTFFYTRLDAK